MTICLKNLRWTSLSVVLLVSLKLAMLPGCGEKKFHVNKDIEAQDADVLPKTIRNATPDFPGFRKELEKLANSISPEKSGETLLSDPNSQNNFFNQIEKFDVHSAQAKVEDYIIGDSKKGLLKLEETESTGGGADFKEFETKVGSLCGEQFSPLAGQVSDDEIAKILRAFAKLENDKWKQFFEEKSPGENQAFRFGIKPIKGTDSSTSAEFNAELSGAANENEVALDFDGSVKGESSNDRADISMKAGIYANAPLKKMRFGLNSRFSVETEKAKGQGAFSSSMDLEFSKPQKMTAVVKLNVNLTKPEAKSVIFEYSMHQLEVDELTTRFIYELNENGTKKSIDLDVKRLTKDSVECWVSRVGEIRQDNPPADLTPDAGAARNPQSP